MPVIAFLIWMVIYSMWMSLFFRLLDGYPDWMENITFLIGFPICATISWLIATKVCGPEYEPDWGFFKQQRRAEEDNPHEDNK